MKIAVIGAQGVGKSSLIAEFVKRRPDYTLIPEIARDMLAERRGVVDSWYDFQLELLWRKTCAEEAVQHLENVISDRTAIDNCAFSDYYKAFPENLLNVLKEFSIAYCIGYYDLFVYLPADDLVFSKNVETEKREHVDRAIRSILPRLNRVLTLRGSLSERVESLCRRL